jgi:F-type H+-transporting ATPase subunit c
MRRRVLFISMLGLLAILLAVPVLAQGTPETAGKAESGASNWFIYLPAFAMAIASSVCGLGQSRAIVAACESVSRNPGAADSIRFFLILGLVLIESLALYTLLIIFAK